MMEFPVHVVATQEPPQEVCFLLALGESEDGATGEHLMLQGPSVDEEDDDRPCLVTPSGTTYAPVLSWGLADRVLVIRLSDKAAAELGIEEGLRMDLHSLADITVREVETGVARVLVDVPRDDNLATARPRAGR